MTVLLLLLTLAGASALFLYGMKLLSESLQKIMGDRIRAILSSMSSNRIKGILTGIFITALIQSSSATTVMVVSFVNAGILRLFDAITIIMGANVGTTITSWIIAVFGFEVNFSIYALPLIGVSIPLLFSSRRKIKNWGEMLLGFALLFVSLRFIKEAIPQFEAGWSDPFFGFIASWGYLSYLIFIVFGAVVTVIIRSSSAIIALTMVLALNGWIDFYSAAAMVMGENVGTTLAAISAARIANVTAKRAALAHLFFNLFGVVWILAIFPLYIKGFAWLYVSIGGANPLQQSIASPLALALFHTLFNLLNGFILIGFSKNIARFVSRKIPSTSQSDSEFKLRHIKIGLLSTPDASLFQAKRETTVFAEKVRKMFLNVERAFDETSDREYALLSERIRETEEYADRLEKEIATYLTKVGEGRLSESSSKSMRALFKMIDDIESIADSCINILNAIDRKHEMKVRFPEQINNNVRLMFNMVRDALDMMVTMLTHNEELPLSMAVETEKEINNFRDILKSEHLNNLEKGVYKYDAGIVYNDIISQCERIGDYAINVDESYKNTV
ncbi:MAG: Na/Pi cotransporter family protein [Prolixibacteraceae bacterium]|nr:Na/Pi cotransporter family protein [Prolixibacteraceae bacterium]MBN2648719.1 Na/Pi cotransporter family protein [Prolixibacteraceae bacterium]